MAAETSGESGTLKQFYCAGFLCVQSTGGQDSDASGRELFSAQCIEQSGTGFGGSLKPKGFGHDMGKEKCNARLFGLEEGRIAIVRRKPVCGHARLPFKQPACGCS